MLLMEANGIKKSYGERLVLNLPTFKLYRRERIGIVGWNGAGKTTLLNILAGDTGPDEGWVKRYAKHSFIRQLEDPEDLGKAGGGREIGTLSGGEKTRLKIERAFQFGGEILLADEPTANLDLEGIRRLEEQLLAFPGAILLISHDRELLDRVCTRILEVEEGLVTEFPGNYTSYRQQKEAKVERQGFEYDQYSREKKRLLAAIREREGKAQSVRKTPTRMGNSEARLHRREAGLATKQIGKAAKAMQSRIEMLEKKEKPRERKTVRFDIDASQSLGARVAVRATEVNKSFGQRVLFCNAGFALFSGSKAALLGGNGSGKTTLLRMVIAGVRGIDLAQAAKIGYLSQGLEELAPEKTILENVLTGSIYPAEEVRTILGRLLFKGDDVHKQVGVLSGGERVKTAFARMVTGEFNLLVLDEPTNFLDIESLEALEEILVEYPGTILFASHDRRFIERVADCILQIEDHKIVQFAGTYREFLQHRADREKRTKRLERMMLLENRLSQVMGKLCLIAKGEEYDALDAEYRKTLQELQQLKQRAN